ncbi:MAG: cupin domain-containing protein [Cyanobacteria bacterium P01_E01_bin.42]
MGLVRTVTLQTLESIEGGMARFYTPQLSHETMLVQIAPNTVDDLFVHLAQTDQLLVVRGGFVLVVLQNRQYRYIPLSEDKPQIVKIPRGVPHAAINLDSEPCVLVNAVLRHGEMRAKDYQPIAPPFAYDLELARQISTESRSLAVPIA